MKNLTNEEVEAYIQVLFDELFIIDEELKDVYCILNNVLETIIEVDKAGGDLNDKHFMNFFKTIKMGLDNKQNKQPPATNIFNIDDFRS